MKKIVVIGSRGFIGSALSLKLREICNPKLIATSSTVVYALDRSASWLEPDLWDADVVYLCAGRTGGVGRMANDPMSFLYPNVRIHMNVFETCMNAGVKRVVCLNSTTGYPDSREPMREEDYLTGELHPAYYIPGNAHRFIYRLSQAFKEIEFVFFRPSNVYGPGNNFDPETSHVIEATVRKVKERQNPFVIWGTGEDVRDAIYIDDLVDAMLYGIDCAPGAYNIGTGSQMSVNEIVTTLLDHAGFHPNVQHDLSKPSAIHCRRVDILKALAMGWRPNVPMREGLVRTYDWYASMVSKAE